MSTHVSELAKQHHAFYEVSSYYLVVQENPGKIPVKNRTIRAGFDIDIYGVNNKNEPVLPGPDYVLGCAELQKVAQQISHKVGDSCAIEVISFPSRMVLGGSGHPKVEAMIRLRIRHRGNPDEAAAGDVRGAGCEGS